jgi:hypothetical protein
MRRRKTRERPILFSRPMVRAIMRGDKVETRRVIRPQPWKGMIRVDPTHLVAAKYAMDACPYGGPGDRLWVRETWASRFKRGSLKDVLYRASLPHNSTPISGKWRPSLLMPRRMARIILEITHVRAQRLHDMTEADARAEGVRERLGITDFCPHWPDAVHGLECFKQFWNHLNGQKVGGKKGWKGGGPNSWDANPWVWAITFRRIKP